MRKRLKITLPHWRDLVALTEEELGGMDVAILNLACAQGLPGGPTPEQAAECIDRLEHYARTVTDYTEKQLPEFYGDRGHYDDSEAMFRIVMMVSMLQCVHGVRYNPEKIPADSIHTAADAFIHGPLVGEGGTCASLPVVYAAVGRRVGYPILLVSAKNHTFCRWEGDGERFNIEVNNFSTDMPSDDHYRQGMYSMSLGLEISGRFLLSHSACEELAVFMRQRAAEWFELGEHGALLKSSNRQRRAA